MSGCAVIRSFKCIISILCCHEVRRERIEMESFARKGLLGHIMRGRTVDIEL